MLFEVEVMTLSVTQSFYKSFLLEEVNRSNNKNNLKNALHFFLYINN